MEADFFTQITDEAVAVHRRFAETIPTPLSTMHLYPISGAAARLATVKRPYDPTNLFHINHNIPPT